jgi:hypothetical protein
MGFPDIGAGEKDLEVLNEPKNFGDLFIKPIDAGRCGSSPTKEKEKVYLSRVKVLYVFGLS